MGIPKLKFPSNYEEFYQVAKSLVGRFAKSQSVEDLFGAVLAVHHVSEWSHRGPKKQDSGTPVDPRRQVLGDIAAGLKHSKARRTHHPRNLKRGDPEWEDDNFWELTGVWAIDLDGKQVTVEALCKEHLDWCKTEFGKG